MTTTCQKNLVFGVHTSVLSSVSHMSTMSGKSGFWSLYTSTCKPHVKRIWSLKSVHLRFSPSQVVTTCLKDPEFGVRICPVSPMAHLATMCPKKITTSLAKQLKKLQILGQFTHSQSQASSIFPLLVQRLRVHRPWQRLLVGREWIWGTGIHQCLVLSVHGGTVLWDFKRFREEHPTTGICQKSWQPNFRISPFIASVFLFTPRPQVPGVVGEGLWKTKM